MDFDAEHWIRFEYTEVDAADVNVPERLGWHAVGSRRPWCRRCFPICR